MKKIIIYSFYILASTSILSCSDEFLELAPVDSSNTGSFYKTEADMEAAIVGVYDAWKDATVWLPTRTEYRADNLTNDRYYGFELAENALNAATTEREWNTIFQGLVYRSNVVLENVENIRNSNSQLTDQIKGEALFFRGYAYYYGALNFGGLPLITSTVSIDEALATPRATEAETWLQAENDLKEAVGLLPIDAAVFGRVDKHAAAAFLARTLLQQRKWAEAVPILQDIRTNSGHSLETVWTDMWTEEAEKTSPEYMLTSIWSPIDRNEAYGEQFLFLPGVNAAAQGVFIYKPGVLESFEEGDVRKEATAENDVATGRSLNNKYDYGIGNNSNFTMDLVAMRFADVELMYAEAITMAEGSVQQASIDIINTIRNRAELGDSPLTTGSSLNVFVETLLAERRVEFLWEGTRFADLKRHDLLLDKLSDIGYNYNEAYLLLPIPALEIIKMQGLWTQNPGYIF